MNLIHAMGHLEAHFKLRTRADADGAYGLRFGPVTVAFRPGPQGEGIVLQSRLGCVDPRDPDLFDALLAANLVPASVHGGSLGLDAEMTVFLTLCLDEKDLDFPLLLRALVPFVGRARHWQAQLAAATPTGPCAPGGRA